MSSLLYPSSNESVLKILQHCSTFICYFSYPF